MIVALHGKNSFDLNVELRRIIDGAIQKNGDIGVERYNAPETETNVILQAVQSLPFLVPKKLVVVDNAGASSELMDQLEQLIDRTPNEVDVVLVGPIFDKRKSSYNLLKKHTKVIEFPEDRPQELPVWVVKYAKTFEAIINRPDALYLVERVGVNKLRLASEIEKMSLYTADINREVIDKLTDESAQSSVFALLDAAFAGDSKRALKLYREQRQNRVEPHYIVAMLSWQLNSLAMAVYADPHSETTLMNAGLTPFSARKSLSLSRNISKSKLKNMVVELSDLDLQIKTNTEPDAGLELYILSLAG